MLKNPYSIILPLFHRQLSSWFIAFLVFFLTVRFLRLLRFNKKISLLSSTLRHSARMLISFSFVFNIAFLSFACTAYLFFMSRLFEFRSYIVTLETLLSMMLGKLTMYFKIFILNDFYS